MPRLRRQLSEHNIIAGGHLTETIVSSRDAPAESSGP